MAAAIVTVATMTVAAAAVTAAAEKTMAVIHRQQSIN